MTDHVKLGELMIHLRDMTVSLAPPEISQITLGVKPDDNFAVFSYRTPNGEKVSGGTENGGDFGEIIRTAKELKEGYAEVMVWDTIGLTVKDNIPVPCFDMMQVMSKTPLPREGVLEWAIEEFEKYEQMRQQAAQQYEQNPPEVEIDGDEDDDNDVEDKKMFKIKDLDFEIKSAYVDAFVSSIDNQLIFSLYIETEENEDIFMGYPACFNSEILLKFNPGEISQWQDIAGKTVEWEDCPDDSEPHALLYVFEHEEVYHAKIEFVKTGDKIAVKINARCDVFYDDDYSEDLPLQIETEVDFYGIACGKDASEEDCRNKIKPFMDVDTLKYIKNGSVSVMAPKENLFIGG
jgi:hypothetical protein